MGGLRERFANIKNSILFVIKSCDRKERLYDKGRGFAFEMKKGDVGQKFLVCYYGNYTTNTHKDKLQYRNQPHQAE